MESITLPEALVRSIRERGLDVEDLVINLLIKSLNLDPKIAVEAHVELALKYLEEGRGLADKDTVQASEKLYKAAEEVVKALAIHYGFDDILNRVNERGRWTVTELEKAVLRISKHLGDWVRAVWDEANYLRVWGFHEARLDGEDVMARLPDIERIVREAENVLLGSN
ncbi:MAG: PaREP1 family protein [Vulcanisaeta sp.]|nr:PaREP1 family protein [Vulcanisaeta sp.]